MDMEKLKWITFENNARLPSLRNQDWKTVKAETENVNEL